MEHGQDSRAAWLRPHPEGEAWVYLLFTRALCPPERNPFDQLRRALEGGVRVVQIREKGLGASEAIDLVGTVRELIADLEVDLVWNDRTDIALHCEVEGVHLGQDDLPPALARALAVRAGHPDLVIGCSTHDETQAQLAERDPSVDYLGVGPLFPTATKGYREGIGPEAAARMQKLGGKPCFWIGGITPANRNLLPRPFGVAASSAILLAADPAAAVRALRG